MKGLSRNGSIRIGPISIFGLIILLCLVVLALLCANTAQAAFASAQKQALINGDTYANEVKAQEFVAFVDAELALSRAEGTDGLAALDLLEKKLPAQAWAENENIYAEFVQESGRKLSITLTITEDARYEITQWQATTRWDAGEGETLWQGSAQ